MRKKVTPALVIATVALFISLGGGAYAAGKYLINSASQINPSVLQSLHGPRGPRGKVGNDGAAGVDGLAGAQGIQGIPGANGAVGPQGIQGVPGPVGPTGPGGGAQGPAGPAGPAGAVGPAGAQGPQGSQGQQGPQGVQGPAGSAQEYARVSISGGGIVQDNLNFGGSFTQPSTGIYCMTPQVQFSYNEPVALVSVDASVSTALGLAFNDSGNGFSGVCPSGDYIVKTTDLSGNPSNAVGFSIAIP